MKNTYLLYQFDIKTPDIIQNIIFFYKTRKVKCSLSYGSLFRRSNTVYISKLLVLCRLRSNADIQMPDCAARQGIISAGLLRNRYKRKKDDEFIGRFGVNLILLLAFLLMSSSSLYSQIGGLAADKLAAYNAAVVPHLNLEFEPSFSYVQRSTYWNGNSDIKNIYQSLDSVHVISSMGIRFSFGLWDKIDMGVNFSPDLGNISTGFRYLILDKDKYGLAAIAGANIPLGNKTLDKTLNATSNIANYGVGIASTYYLSEKFSTDFSAQYMFYAQKTQNNDKGGVFLNLDFGYKVFNESMMLMTGFAYHNIQDNAGGHELLVWNAGFIIAAPKQYDIIISMPLSIYGKRELKNAGFVFAVNVFLD